MEARLRTASRLGEPDAQPQAPLYYAARVRRMILSKRSTDPLALRLGDGLGRDWAVLHRNANVERAEAVMSSVRAGLADRSSIGGRMVACAMNGVQRVVEAAAGGQISSEIVPVFLRLPRDLARRFIAPSAWDSLASRDAVHAPDLIHCSDVALRATLNAMIGKVDLLASWVSLVDTVRPLAKHIIAEDSTWRRASTMLHEQIADTLDASILRLHHALDQLWLERQGGLLRSPRHMLSAADELSTRVFLFGHKPDDVLAIDHLISSADADSEVEVWRCIVGSRPLLYLALLSDQHSSWSFLTRQCIIEMPHDAAHVATMSRQLRMLGALSLAVRKAAVPDALPTIISIFCNDCRAFLSSSLCSI